MKVDRHASLMLAVLLVLHVLPCMGTEKTSGKALFTWDLVWTGSWYKSIKTQEGDSLSSEDLFSGGTLYNRGDILLGLPKLDLSFRFLAIDKRLLPPDENDGKAGFNPAAGIYHHGSASRFLYGVQSEYGLPARINNIWLRSVPYMESRNPSSRDLKTEPAAKDTKESYLYLALPKKFLPGFNAFFSAALDEELNSAFGTGLGFEKNKMELRLEGYYTQKELPPRTISTWFSSAPPLPERDFRIFAFGALFSSPLFSIATDWAYSETFAWGSGIYGNFALSVGNKPWRFSFAGDGAGGRFADRSGSTSGAGFRLAAKGERFWPRSGLLRFQGTFRSPGLEEEFNRGYLSVYYRPSAPSAAARRANSFPVRFTRASLSINRDARNPEKTADTLDAMAGFYFGPLSTVFTFSYHGVSCLDEDSGFPVLFQFPAFESFESLKFACELGLKLGIFDIRTKLSHTIRAEKASLWEPSLNFSVKPGKWGRIGLKIAFTDFPGKWNYTLSWRFAYNDKL